jgi:hypothetical protein
MERLCQLMNRESLLLIDYIRLFDYIENICLLIIFCCRKMECHSESKKYKPRLVIGPATMSKESKDNGSM